MDAGNTENEIETEAPPLAPLVLTLKQCAELAACSKQAWLNMVAQNIAPKPQYESWGPRRERRFLRWNKAEVEEFLTRRRETPLRAAKRTG